MQRLRDGGSEAPCRIHPRSGAAYDKAALKTGATHEEIPKRQRVALSRPDSR